MPESWKYKKPEEQPTDPVPVPDVDVDATPPLDFKFDIEHEGKNRRVEMTAAGLYVFDKSEEFEVPQTKPRPTPRSTPLPTGRWVGFKHPMSSGNVLIPAASKPGDFKTVKIRGKGIKAILNLTKKTK